MSKNKSEFVSAAGRVFEILKAMADAVYAAGGSDEHIVNAFLKDSARLKAIVAIIVHGVAAATPATADTAVPVNHRNVHVSYALPAFEQLDGALFNWASNLWDGREWKRHPQCAEIDKTPRELVFFMKHFGKVMTSEQVIEWAEANGYRAANHLETLAYAMANPEDQRKFWYVGLGSFAVSDDRQYFAYLSGDGRERGLGDDYLADGWHAVCRFLLVRK